MSVATRYRAFSLGRARWGRQGTTHRLGWGLADQAVSSLTNFLVVIFVARSLGPREFGIFSLAYATYAFSLNVSRGVATDPLVVRFSGVARESWRDAVRVASGTATTVGCVVGAACAIGGLAVSGALGGTLVALGVLLPGLLLQDSWRYAFFAAGDGWKSFVNDLVWGLALVPLVALAAHQGGVAWFVVAWGGAGSLAALVGAFQAGMLPQLSGTRTWLSQQRELGARYFAENLSISAATQLRITFVGLIAGLSAVGQVRAAEVLLGPWIAVLMGLSMVAVPEAARALRRSVRTLVVFCTALAIVQAAGVIVWGLSIMFLLPDELGARLLGALWEPAEALVLPTTLAFAGIGLWNGAAAGLRALAAARRSLRATLVCACAYLTGGVGGALVGDAVGSAWGVAAATATGGVVWWWQLRAGLRDLHDSEASPDRADIDPPDMEGTPLLNAAPRLTVGLPVFNGENYLTEALDSLLGQTFSDFELIISDNHSTDSTEEICRQYAARDPRIRYVRQARNLGCNPNHNFLVGEARAPYFKWAAHDDLYGPELLARCVAVLDEEPDVVLSHVDKAVVDEQGTVVQKFDYLLATGSADPVERFRSLVVADGADDEYGVMRTRVLRSVRPKDSYHHAARPFIAEIAFRGRFHQVRELLYFRRDHPNRGDRRATIPALSTNLDPGRAGQGAPRLMAEYAYRYFEAVAGAPISRPQRLACYGILAGRLSVSGLHRVMSRNGDPLWAAGQPAATDLPAPAGATRGDTTS